MHRNKKDMASLLQAVHAGRQAVSPPRLIQAAMADIRRLECPQPPLVMMAPRFALAGLALSAALALVIAYAAPGIADHLAALETFHVVQVVPTSISL